MDAQRGLSVSGHRNTVLCLHLTSDTYHVTPSGRAPRARGKFWIRRVKLRIFRPDPKSHKSEGFPAAQIFKTHKSQNTYCRSAHFSKAVKIVGAQNPRGTTCLTAPCEGRGPGRGHIAPRGGGAAKHIDFARGGVGHGCTNHSSLLNLPRYYLSDAKNSPATFQFSHRSEACRRESPKGPCLASHNSGQAQWSFS